MLNTSSARRSRRVVGRTTVASGPATTSLVARMGALFRSWRWRAWERLRSGRGGGRREERSNGSDSSGGRGGGVNLVQFGVGSGCRVRRDERARAPHIRLIFGLNMEGAGQPGRLRGSSRLKNRDRTPAQAYETNLRGPVVYALTIFPIYNASTLSP